MPKPATFSWATSPGTTSEPSSGKKASGYASPELPSDLELNWLLNLIGLWIAYFDALLVEGAVVPAGAIIMVEGASCPAGYTRQDNFADKFPRGATVAASGGTNGGNDSHTHTGPSHTHAVSGTTSAGIGDGIADSDGYTPVYSEHHTHTFSVTSGAGGTGNTGSSSNVPAYRTVLFCKKD